MIAENALQVIQKQLFADPRCSVYTVLDGASVPDMLDRLHDLEPEYFCLLQGELEPDDAETAPYVVQLEPASGFTQWVLREGWGQHWGIFAAAPVDLRTIRRHFRTFTMVLDPEGKSMYFRYYDPRVFRVYLPTCTDEELGTVFGPVRAYLMEDEPASALLRFWPAGRPNAMEKVPLY